MKESLQAPAQEPIKLAPMPALGLSLQRKCACGGSPGHGGECDECRQKRLALKPRSSGGGGFFVGSLAGHDFSRVRVSNSTLPRIQTKLDVSEPGDVWEQEADLAAAQVVQGPEGAGGFYSPPQPAQRGSKGEAPAEAAPPAAEAPIAAPEEPTAASPEATPEAAAPGTAEAPTPEAGPAAGLIVEDDATDIAPGQMRRERVPVRHA